VFERVLQETNPVLNAYGTGSVVTAADAPRAEAAALLGCTADEILITRGTTEGIISAQGGLCRWRFWWTFGG
jgi:selenocysteine lyase/cysteine desulfurase